MIKIAIIGVGNCASSLIQGIYYYRKNKMPDTVMNWDIGGYLPGDIEVVAAFDIDKRKVGKDLSEAIFSKPNCTKIIYESVPKTNINVSMGRTLDGYSSHMKEYPIDTSFQPSNGKESDVVKILKESGAEIVLCYLPVGSEKAVKYYTECCLEAGVALINCMPVFIASDPEYAKKFTEKGIPIIGDDVKSQIGATIIHRVLSKLFRDRGTVLENTYQLNVGGNTDFLNMLSRERLKSKKISKTEAVQSTLDKRLNSNDIHIGPSDYVPWMKDNKVCFLKVNGRIFGNVPITLDLRLSVEDSPNSGGCIIDAIRCCKIALDRKIGGPLLSISSYTMKHPPEQYPEDVSKQMVKEFIENGRER